MIGEAKLELNLHTHTYGENFAEAKIGLADAHTYLRASLEQMAPDDDYFTEANLLLSKLYCECGEHELSLALIVQLNLESIPTENLKLYVHRIVDNLQLQNKLKCNFTIYRRSLKILFDSYRVRAICQKAINEQNDEMVCIARRIILSQYIRMAKMYQYRTFVIKENIFNRCCNLTQKITDEMVEMERQSTRIPAHQMASYSRKARQYFRALRAQRPHQ